MPSQRTNVHSVNVPVPRVTEGRELERTNPQMGKRPFQDVDGKRPRAAVQDGEQGPQPGRERASFRLEVLMRLCQGPVSAGVLDENDTPVPGGIVSVLDLCMAIL